MRVDTERNPQFFQAAPAQTIERRADVLKILRRCAPGPAGAHIGFLMIASELLAESNYAQVFLDERSARGGDFKACAAAARTTGDGGKLDADPIDPLFQA